MQVKILHKLIDELQIIHGDKTLASIYGAGCIDRPDLMLVFMNPTARNVSASHAWQGLRAPWLGTKKIWQMLYGLRIISEQLYKEIKEYKPEAWSYNFAEEVYTKVAQKKVYITNLAKCTQLDARPLHNKIFKEYLDIMKQEIALINPKHIIAFGNQVSSILLERPIKVSDYKDAEYEELIVHKKIYKVYPVFYPVGQGRRNMPQAIERIKKIWR
jgi:uracil-DNA glycosylase